MPLDGREKHLAHEVIGDVTSKGLQAVYEQILDSCSACKQLARSYSVFSSDRKARATRLIGWDNVGEVQDMNSQEISCTVEGRIFTGTFEVVGHGEVGAVSVQLDGDAISARTGAIPPEIVARTLLGELVREKLRNNEQPRAKRKDLGLNTDRMQYRYGPQLERNLAETHH